MQHFIGIYTELVTIRSPQSRLLRDNFKLLRLAEDYPMGWKRFQSIYLSLIPNDEEFERVEYTLRTTYQAHWLPGREICVDESLWAYAPGSGKKKQARNSSNHIPLEYISRKPHRNGLLAYEVLCHRSIISS